MYKTRINTFYSRRIDDIDWGGKVTGKIGDYGFNVLVAHRPEITDEDQPRHPILLVKTSTGILYWHPVVHI